MAINTVWTNGNRSRRRRFVTATLAASAFLAVLGAQPARAREVPVQSDRDRERPEIARDRWDRRGDWQDVRQFERTLDRLVAAERNGDSQAEQRARERIYQLIRRELAEARRDAWSDRGEMRGNWEDRPNGRDDRYDSRNDSRDSRDDRYDKRNDSRDSRDDRRDWIESRRRLERERAIAAELRSMQREIRRGTPRALARERALLNEFLRIERQDARASGREFREDRGDRRDSWGDRQDRQDAGDRGDRDREEPGEDAEPF